MTKIGYLLSCEEWGPHELLEQARMAQGAGFEALWISDHSDGPLEVLEDL